MCLKWVSPEQCKEQYSKLLKVAGIKERFEAVYMKCSKQRLANNGF